jgi:hypothetical protein
MGTFLSTQSNDTINIINTKIILINQASCYKCNSTLKDRGICKCGNVEIYGGNEELGRRVKHMDHYSDCSLIEYRPIRLV